MRILTTRNKTSKGYILGIYHSVFVSKGEVYSFEGKSFLGKRTIKIWKEMCYNKRIKEVVQDIEIPEFDIDKYRYFTSSKNCHEFIDYVLDKENIDMKFIHIKTEDIVENFIQIIRNFFIITFLFICSILFSFWQGYNIGYEKALPKNTLEAIKLLDAQLLIENKELEIIYE